MTFLGGTTNYSKLDGEEAEEELEGCTDGQSGKDMEFGRGNLGGGGERGDKFINENQINSANLKSRV